MLPVYATIQNSKFFIIIKTDTFSISSISSILMYESTFKIHIVDNILQRQTVNQYSILSYKGTIADTATVKLNDAVLRNSDSIAIKDKIPLDDIFGILLRHHYLCQGVPVIPDIRFLYYSLVGSQS